MSSIKPTRLPTELHERPWGAADLAPWFPTPDKKIGEVWFQADLPLLVKFVFTTDRLSVQVHPDDAFAGAHENSLGKTEMWYILRADPGAQLAIGLRETVSRECLREAAVSGEIQKMLNWIPVTAGDAFFVPPGTIHAIGPGLAICEVQQHSNITYRFYDYGRPRELHLDKAVEVALLEAAKPKPEMLPIDCRYFHTELARINIPLEYTPEPKRFHILVFVAGRGTIDDQPFQEGQAWLVPAGADRFTITPTDAVKLLRTWVP